MKNKGLMLGCGVAGGALILVILIFVVWGISVYNNLVNMEEQVNSSWSQVENQYQRRMDLVPNLVNTVKGVAEFEKETYTAVTEARAQAGQVKLGSEILNNPQAFQKFQNAQQNLSGALSRLLVTVENYPKLKANENFQQLQAQLEGTENRIAVERRKFNQAVQQYNSTIRKFPANMVAGIYGFEMKEYFTSDEGADEAPKVEF